MYPGKMTTNNEVDVQHQAWHEQVWFGGGKRPSGRRWRRVIMNPDLAP